MLRPGGIYFVLVPNIFWYKDLVSVLFRGTRVTRNQTHERFASMGEWKELLEEAKLPVKRIIKYNGIADFFHHGIIHGKCNMFGIHFFFNGYIFAIH